jgi:hypothetical protein
MATSRTLHRLVSGVAALVFATAAAVCATAAPAHADRWEGWYYLRNVDTRWCLAADHNANVSSFHPCGGPQRWEFQHLDAYPGEVLIKNEATKQCLMQFDFTRVVTTSCTGHLADRRWKVHRGGYIYSVNTDRYLTDHAIDPAVYLSPWNDGIRQRWNWAPTA